MNEFNRFLQENGLSNKLVESISNSELSSKVENIDITINFVDRLYNNLHNNFLYTKLHNIRIYEFPLVEEEIEEISLLISFEEIIIKDLISLIYNRKTFLSESQIIIGSQDKTLYQIINCIENQPQETKLVIVSKLDKNLEYLISNIYILFTI